MEIPKELLDYVASARESGASDNLIRDELIRAGWDNATIDSVVPVKLLPIAKPIESNVSISTKENLKPEPTLDSNIEIKIEPNIIQNDLSTFNNQNQTLNSQTAFVTPKRTFPYALIIFILLLVGIGVTTFFYFPKIKTLISSKNNSTNTLPIQTEENGQLVKIDPVEKEKILKIYYELENLIASSTPDSVLQMNMVPKDRTIDNVDTSSYIITRALGYQFATPWGKGFENEKTKKSTSVMQIDYPNGKTVIISCSPKKLKDEFLETYSSTKEDILSILNYFSDKANSNFELINSILSVTSGYVLNSDTVDQANLFSKIILLKPSLLPSGDQIYLFTTPYIKGFQSGDYAKSQLTIIDIFPDNETLCRLTATEKSNLSQKDVDTILSTFQKPIVAEQPKTTTAPKSENSIPTGNKITTTDSWKLFDQYVLAVKDQNIDALNQISYKKMPSCPPGSEKECNALLVFVYDSVKNLDKSKYTNIISDNKQIILSTNLVYTPPSEDKKTALYEKGYLLLAKDNAGVLKLVSFSPNKIWGINTEGSSTYKQTLDEMVVDSDNDGATDQAEICSGASKYDSKCKKTDPNKMDTDGDGLWDGIEEHLK